MVQALLGSTASMKKTFAGMANPGGEEHLALSNACFSMSSPWGGDYLSMCQELLETAFSLFEKVPNMHPAVRVSVTRDIAPYLVGCAQWAATGFPVFNLTLDFFRAMRVTDFGDVGEEIMHCPYAAYLIRFPEPLKDGVRTGFVYPVPVAGNGQLAFAVRRFSLAASSGTRQAYTQWRVGTSYAQFLNGTPATIESVDELERITTDLLGFELDSDLTKQARRVLGNTFLYVNANGGLPAKKILGAEVAVEREHEVAPRFRVGRPIKLGPKIREMLEPGRSGKTWELEKRFVVRGHWRNQAYGAEWALRRKQWIQPFWKGSEDFGETLVRTFEVG